MIYDYNLNISELWSYPIIQSKNLKYAVDWMSSSEATFRVVSLHFYCDTSLNLIQKIQIYCESHQTHKKKNAKKTQLFFELCSMCSIKDEIPLCSICFMVHLHVSIMISPTRQRVADRCLLPRCRSRSLRLR